jgi:hypothetical protein
MNWLSEVVPVAADSSARMHADGASAGYGQTVDADVLGSTEVDEGALRRLLRRAAEPWRAQPSSASSCCSMPKPLRK